LDEKYLNGSLSEAAYWKICRENAVRLLKLEA
jgi:predicted TIM-barrel fold metal-dependent hydrolase